MSYYLHIARSTHVQTFTTTTFAILVLYTNEQVYDKGVFLHRKSIFISLIKFKIEVNSFIFLSFENYIILQ